MTAALRSGPPDAKHTYMARFLFGVLAQLRAFDCQLTADTTTIAKSALRQHGGRSATCKSREVSAFTRCFTHSLCDKLTMTCADTTMI
jgi:hypothetical protein